MLQCLTKLCERTWDQEAVPQDFKDARIVHIQVEGKQLGLVVTIIREFQYFPFPARLLPVSYLTDYRYTFSTTG